MPSLGLNGSVELVKASTNLQTSHLTYIYIKESQILLIDWFIMGEQTNMRWRLGGVVDQNQTTLDATNPINYFKPFKVNK